MAAFPGTSYLATFVLSLRDKYSQHLSTNSKPHQSVGRARNASRSDAGGSTGVLRLVRIAPRVRGVGTSFTPNRLDRLRH